MATRIYVSHSHGDRRLVDEIAQFLAERGPFEVWIDAPNTGRQAIEEADIVLLMLSPAYLESNETWEQMGLALKGRTDGRANVIPVLLSEVDIKRTPAAGIVPFPRDGVPIDHRVDREAVLREFAEELERMVSIEAPPPPPTQISLSSSVQAAIGGLSGDVDAATIVRRLVERHPEYGDGAARSLTVEDVPGPKRSPDAWMASLRSLYREDVVPQLHGRFVIRGLALLDPPLTKCLLDHGFLAALEGELPVPLDDALTAHGRRLWEPGTVPTLADRPAKTDQLRRESFAAGLAEMIEEERSGRDKPESFLVHLHGPWGSGKTSLLGFLAKKLRTSERRWVVVEFNAWQHERLGAPWWSLMTAVHREGLRAPFEDDGRARDLWRSLRLIWFEVKWRVRLGWMAYLLLPAVIGVLWFGWNEGWFDTATAETGWLTQAGDVAKPVAAIVGLVAALLGAARGLGRSLAVGSARGAETFIRTSRDPMRTLRSRYEKLVRTIGRPVAVFIDDLDRCQASYVVEVLQGVQTLLIEAPVTYVVAADRRWLYDSYAKHYADFRSVAREPGRPLGHLFLEKTFQLSAALPQLAPDVREEYWRWLIGRGPEADAAEGVEAAQALARAGTAGLDQVAAGATGGSPPAEREALAERLAAPEVQEEIENRLAPFAGLLEPNPRAMKRLVNAYRIELRRLLTEGRRVGAAAVTPEQIALWTIVSLRWPLLADQLALQPELLAGASNEALRPSMRELLASPDVQAVVRGDGVSARLTAHAVRTLAGLQRRPRDDEAVVAPVETNGQGVVA